MREYISEYGFSKIMDRRYSIFKFVKNNDIVVNIKQHEETIYDTIPYVAEHYVMYNQLFDNNN